MKSVRVDLLIAVIDGVCACDRMEPLGELRVHVDALEWDLVVLESDNLASAHSFESHDGDPVRCPIKHGVYTIGVHLSDGRGLVRLPAP